MHLQFNAEIESGNTLTLNAKNLVEATIHGSGTVEVHGDCTQHDFDNVDANVSITIASSGSMIVDNEDFLESRNVTGRVIHTHGNVRAMREGDEYSPLVRLSHDEENSYFEVTYPERPPTPPHTHTHLYEYVHTHSAGDSHGDHEDDCDPTINHAAEHAELFEEVRMVQPRINIVTITDNALPSVEAVVNGLINNGETIVIENAGSYMVSSSGSSITASSNSRGSSWRNIGADYDTTRMVITTQENNTGFPYNKPGVTASDFVSSSEMVGVRYSDSTIKIWNNDGTNILSGETTYNTLVSTNSAVAALSNDGTISVWSSDVADHFPESLHTNNDFRSLQGFEQFFMGTKNDDSIVVWPQAETTSLTHVRTSESLLASITSQGNAIIDGRHFSMVKDIVAFDDGSYAVLKTDGSVYQTLTMDTEFASAVSFGVIRIMSDPDGGLVAIKRDSTAVRWCNREQSNDEIEAFFPDPYSSTCYLLKDQKIHNLRISNIDFVKFDLEHFWEYSRARSRYEHRHFVYGFDPIIGDYPFMEKIYPGIFLHVQNFGNFEGFYQKHSDNEFRKGSYRLKLLSNGKLRFITKNYIYTSTTEANFTDMVQNLSFLTNTDHVWNNVIITMTKQYQHGELTVGDVLNSTSLSTFWSPEGIFHRGLIPNEEIILLGTDFAEIGRVTWSGKGFDLDSWNSLQYSAPPNTKSVKEVLTRTVRKRITMGEETGVRTTSTNRPYHEAHFVKGISTSPRDFPIENVPTLVASTELDHVKHTYNIRYTVSAQSGSGDKTNHVVGDYIMQPDGIQGQATYQMKKTDSNYKMFASADRHGRSNLVLRDTSGYGSYPKTGSLIYTSQELFTTKQFELLFRKFTPFTLAFDVNFALPYDEMRLHWTKASASSEYIYGYPYIKIHSVRSRSGVALPLPSSETGLKFYMAKRESNDDAPSGSTTDYHAYRDYNVYRNHWLYDDTADPARDDHHWYMDNEDDFWDEFWGDNRKSGTVWIRLDPSSRIRFRNPSKGSVNLTLQQTSFTSKINVEKSEESSNIAVSAFYDRHPDLYTISRKSPVAECLTKFVKGSASRGSDTIFQSQR